MNKGKSIPIGDGISIVNTLSGSTDPIHTDPIFVEHEGNRIARVGKWKLVSYYDKPWELFNLDVDRSESKDLVSARPNITRRLKAAYEKWAERAGVIPWATAKDYSVYTIRRKKLEAANK